jgi:hypothetical protein
VHEVLKPRDLLPEVGSCDGQSLFFMTSSIHESFNVKFAESHDSKSLGLETSFIIKFADSSDNKCLGFMTSLLCQPIPRWQVCIQYLAGKFVGLSGIQMGSTKDPSRHFTMDQA